VQGHRWASDLLNLRAGIDWSASHIVLEIFLLNLLSFRFPVNGECAGFSLTPFFVNQLGKKAKTHEVVIKPSSSTNKFLYQISTRSRTFEMFPNLSFHILKESPSQIIHPSAFAQ